jgi:hypothetical protein
MILPSLVLLSNLALLVSATPVAKGGILVKDAEEILALLKASPFCSSFLHYGPPVTATTTLVPVTTTDTTTLPTTLAPATETTHVTLPLTLAASTLTTTITVPTTGPDDIITATYTPSAVTVTQTTSSTEIVGTIYSTSYITPTITTTSSITKTCMVSHKLPTNEQSFNFW